jgi:hypothetical protein
MKKILFFFLVLSLFAGGSRLAFAQSAPGASCDEDSPDACIGSYLCEGTPPTCTAPATKTTIPTSPTSNAIGATCDPDAFTDTCSPNACSQTTEKCVAVPSQAATPPTPPASTAIGATCDPDSMDSCGTTNVCNNGKCVAPSTVNTTPTPLGGTCDPDIPHDDMCGSNVCDIKTKTCITPAAFAAEVAQTEGVNPSSGGTGNFVPLTNLPVFNGLTTAPTLPAFFNQLYKYCVGIAAVLAFLQIMRAGVMYMGGDSVTETKQARALIGTAILGLVLVLSPVIVFGVINPNILRLNLSSDFSNLNTTSGTTGSTQTTGTQSSGSQTGSQTATPAASCSTYKSITAIPNTCSTTPGDTKIDDSCCPSLQTGNACCGQPST